MSKKVNWLRVFLSIAIPIPVGFVIGVLASYIFSSVVIGAIFSFVVGFFGAQLYLKKYPAICV